MADYYSDLRTQQHVCPNCDWTGTGEACSTGNFFEDLFEIECPECGQRLDALQYPTTEETRLYREALRGQRMDIGLRPERLPNINGDKIVLVWDQDWIEGDRYSTNETVIRYGNREIWRESCGYEVIGHFQEVVKILRRRYGKRLRDIVTPPWTHVDLYGDNLSGRSMEQDARWGLWMTNPDNWLTLEGEYFDEYESLVNPCIERMKEIEFDPVGRPAELSRLERLDQLEDVEGKEITFVWDCEDGDDCRKTVIRYGEKVIWSEPCDHDCFARFKSIKDVLKKKYGEQLWDVAPTVRACINLGDLIWRLWRDREPELKLKYQLSSRGLW